MKNWFSTFVRVLVCVAILVLGCFGYHTYESTLAAAWIPVGMGVVAAVATLPFYRKWSRLTAMDDKTVNLLCHVACMGVIGFSLFLIGNYRLADASSGEEVTVTVRKKFMEEHQKRRRVGKHRYVADGVRREYYLEVVFDNGNVEKLHVSQRTYHQASEGKPKVLVLQKGRFGLPVITKGL